jgi:uncharacterized protein (TIGR03067 family)
MRSQAQAAVPADLLHQAVRNAVSFKSGIGKGTAASARVARLAEWQVAAMAAIGIKAMIAASLSGVLLISAAGLLAWRVVGGAPIEQRVQGVWVLQSLNMNGELNEAAAQLRARITLGENGALVTATNTGTYIIDKRARPMQMTWSIAGSDIPGIFEVRGDTLTLCLNLGPNDVPGTPVPTDFEPGRGKMVIVYTRGQP